MSFRICNGDPGPGFWKRDNSHFPVPMSRYLWELFLPSHDEGIKLGQERYGSIIERFDVVRVRGRIFGGPRFVEGDEQFRRRRVAAERAISGKLWRQDCRDWSALRKAFHNRLLEFARRDPSQMDCAELLETIGALREVFTEGALQHFIQQPASMVPVGDWLLSTREWTKASIAEVINVVQGCRQDSSDYFGAIDRAVEVIRRYPAAMDLIADVSEHPAVRLERLRGVSCEVEEGLGRYMDEYADRIITGFDITDSTLRELPGFTLSIIASRIEPSKKSSGRQSKAVDAEKSLRAKVPQARLEEFDEGLLEAKAAYGLHDEDVRITYLWPLGLLRRAVLTAAKRLVNRGALNLEEDVFQATPEELDVLIAGSHCPSREDLAQRADEWRSWANDDPPASYGDPPALPGEDFLGSACMRISSAILFYLAQMEDCDAQSLQPSWSRIVHGMAASSGCYEGRACIVRGPADFARLNRGDILVARTTSPAYNVILPTVGAVVTDRGGTLCHAAIIAREFGIPAVVGTNAATDHIPDGALIFVDGDRGFVAVRV